MLIAERIRCAAEAGASEKRKILRGKFYMIVKLVNSEGQLRTAKVGFSWTTFFFGFLVPIFRGDAKWAVIMFVASILTLFLAQIVLSFTYNGTYVRELLSKGYRPEDEYSRAVLVAKGYIAG